MMITAAIVIALVILCLCLLGFFSKKSETIAATHDEVATAIENFIEGRSGDHDWDDFLNFHVSDAYLESVRKKCDSVFTEYPATQKGHYCSDEGTEVLRKLASEVRAKKAEPNQTPEPTAPNGRGSS